MSGVYMIRLKEYKEAVGIMYAGDQRMLFDEIDIHCDPYACEYKLIWFNMFFRGKKNCPKFPLTTTEEENDDDFFDTDVMEKRLNNLMECASFDYDSNSFYQPDKKEDDWENFDEFNN